MTHRSNNIDDEIQRIRLELHLVESLREEANFRNQHELNEIHLRFERAKKQVNSHLETKNLKKSIREVKDEIIAISENANKVPSKEALLHAMVRQTWHLLSIINYQKSLAVAQQKTLFNYLEDVLTDEIDNASIVDYQLMNEVDHVDREMKKFNERFARLEWKGLVVPTTVDSESALVVGKSLKEESSQMNSVIAMLEMATVTGSLHGENSFIDKKSEVSFSQFVQIIKPEPQIMHSEGARAC